MTGAPRPPNQRWLKRPPRPSRGSLVGLPPRVGPGWQQLMMGIAVGTACAIVAVVLAQVLGARPGVPGFVAGAGFCAGFTLLWRGYGGTLGDLRNLLR